MDESSKRKKIQEIYNNTTLTNQEKQIEINKIICTNYAKSLLNFDIDNLSRAGLAVLGDSNLNEVRVYSKKITKLGFFEKLFHIFT